MIQSPVSVIVVSYNTCDKLRLCLSRIEPEHELIVVDNASGDGSAEMVRREFPHANFILNPANLGFGPANNVGSAVATRPLWLFLNSDAYADPGAIQKLCSVFEEEEIVGAGGRLLNLDRSLQDSTANQLTLWSVFCEQLYLEKLFRGSKVFSPYWTTRRVIDLPEPVETEQVMGACLMVRAGLEKFDERYFLYCEDTDLCLRLRAHGRIVYVKSAEFVHELGSSSGASPIRGVARYNRGKELYFQIHHGRAARTVCRVLDAFGAVVRALFWFARSVAGGGSAARQKGAGFWRVARGLDLVV